MSSEKIMELQQHFFDGPAHPIDGCSPPSPSLFKSLVRDLRQKLHEDAPSPDDIDDAGALLQQAMDDVACLSRLLRISEASLVEERTSSQAAHSTINDLQHQLQLASNEATSQRDIAFQLKSEIDRSQEHHAELEHNVNALRDALCKSEAYRKDYAKSKKSELLDMQSKVDAAIAEAASHDAAHQRTRALLLSEVETRSITVSSMQRLEGSHAELQAQHQKLQHLCNSQDQQLQVCFKLCSCLHLSALPPPPS
jgi:chromosome segregation ATPase